MDGDPSGTPFTLNDIRTILADSIRELRSGSSSPSTVNALSNATGKILSSVKLEMEYYKAIGKKPNIDAILGARQLQSPPNGEESTG